MPSLAILFEASPGFQHIHLQGCYNGENEVVAILFEASPGFQQGRMTRYKIHLKDKSQSSLKRVLVSNLSYPTIPRGCLGVAILFEASPGFQPYRKCSPPRYSTTTSQSSLKRVLVSNPTHRRGVCTCRSRASQSSLKRVLVSNGPNINAKEESTMPVAILFEASPGFQLQSGYCPLVGNNVAILFEASPGFQHSRKDS